MTDLIRPRVKYVIGPDGSPLTIADLPPIEYPSLGDPPQGGGGCGGARRPAQPGRSLRRYKLTTEEFLSWQASIDEYGLAGLRTTRIQQYRH